MCCLHMDIARLGEGVKTLAQVVGGTFLSTSKWAISSSGGSERLPRWFGHFLAHFDNVTKQMLFFIWGYPHIMRLTFDLDS